MQPVAEIAKKEAQIQPHYAEAFRCIGSECPDTCCAGWKVLIDRETYQKYQALPDLLPVLQTKVTLIPGGGEKDFAHFHMVEDRCPCLSAERLCGIQKEHGEEYLPRGCAQFPRSIRVDGKVTKKTLLLSCPEAARMVLLNPKLLEGEGISDGSLAGYRHFILHRRKSSGREPDLHESLWKLQRFSVVLVNDRRYPMWQRLFLLGMFCMRLHALSSQRQPERVPGLLDKYAQMLVNGDLVKLMEGIRGRPAVQLEVTLKIAQRALQVSRTSSFRGSVDDFLAGISSPDGTGSGGIVAAYEAARTQFYEPMMLAHPFLLENYLTNYILQRAFLSFDNPRGILTDYLILCTHYVVIRTTLIGIAGRYREQFGAQHVVQLVQGFSKASEHNAVFMEEVAKYISDSGLNRPGEMATLCI